jgi:nucleotide-binding universal stress UspA family protein
MLPLRTILHPTDFSPRSDHAFRLACSLARDHNARLILVHVMPPLVIGGELGVVPVEPEGLDRALMDQLNQLQPADTHLPVERYLLQGNAADEIIRLAREKECDLVVMGTHGRTGLDRLLMGSVAEIILRNAPCPVLTVKVGLPAAASSTSERHTEPAQP